MTTPVDNNIDVSFPTFVRLNVQTIGLTEEKKKRRLRFRKL